MKAIIFGVTGQDGSHLADLLLEKDYDVVGISRRCSVDNTERLKHIQGHEKFKLVQGDITDAHSVLNILRDNEDVDEVYNLAAQSHVAVSFKQPALTWDITGKGCLNILQSIVDLKISPRFYQASSSEMFGSNYDLLPQFKVNLLEWNEEKRKDLSYNGTKVGEYISTDSDLKKHLQDPYVNKMGAKEEFGGNLEPIKYQDENTKFLPQSPYAIAKCAAHYMTRLFREAYGVHASAGILFNHEGPRRGENFVTRKITKWIGDFMKWRAEHSEYPTRVCNITETIIAYSWVEKDVVSTFPKLRLGNLDAFRDWGYAGDYVEAMWMMLQQDQPDDYVICTGETHTIRDFLDAAFKQVLIKNWEDYIVIDMEFYRPAEVDYLRGINTKAKDKLGWTPKHSFEDLVAIMVSSELNEDIQNTHEYGVSVGQA